MFPCFAPYQTTSGIRANAIVSGKPLDGNAPCRVAGSNFLDLGFVQPGAGVLHATPGAATLLPVHIVEVIGLGTQEQMSDTSPHIASVEHLQPIRDRPMHQLPRDPMGEEVATADSYSTVAVRTNAANPKPAIRGFVYALPEAGFEGYTCHVNHSFSVVGRTPEVRASRGFTVSIIPRIMVGG